MCQSSYSAYIMGNSLDDKLLYFFNLKIWNKSFLWIIKPIKILLHHFIVYKASLCLHIPFILFQSSPILLVLEWIDLFLLIYIIHKFKYVNLICLSWNRVVTTWLLFIIINILLPFYLSFFFSFYTTYSSYFLRRVSTGRD